MREPRACPPYGQIPGTYWKDRAERPVILLIHGAQLIGVALITSISISIAWQSVKTLFCDHIYVTFLSRYAFSESELIWAF